MNITVKEYEIKNLGSNMLNYADEFYEEIKKFTSLIDSISTAWSGADATKYINTMKEKYVPKMEELQKVLKEYGTYLKNVSSVYTILDEVFASKKIDV